MLSLTQETQISWKEGKVIRTVENFYEVWGARLERRAKGRAGWSQIGDALYRMERVWRTGKLDLIYRATTQELWRAFRAKYPEGQIRKEGEEWLITFWRGGRAYRCKEPLRRVFWRVMP